MITRSGRARAPAQALVELAVVLPLLLIFAAGVLGVSRIVRAHMALSAAAHEAARAAALAPLPLVAPDSAATDTARKLGHEAGVNVASSYGLSNAIVKITFDNGDQLEPGGVATAHVEFELDEKYFTLFRWAPLTLKGDSSEPVDQFRNRGL